jgi:hypothetical protein
MFSRSRPWRPRGPSFGSHVGSRRRGRRTESYVVAYASPVLDDFTFDDTNRSAEAFVEAPLVDELPPLLSANIPAARIDESGLRALANRAHELSELKPADLTAPPAAEGLSPASLVQLLSQRPDDSHHHSRARRSA